MTGKPIIDGWDAGEYEGCGKDTERAVKTIHLDIPTDAAERVRVENEAKPILSIFHQDGRWRTKCAACPDFELSSVTLWSLINLLKDRVTADSERRIKNLRTQGRV